MSFWILLWFLIKISHFRESVYSKMSMWLIFRLRLDRKRILKLKSLF